MKKTAKDNIITNILPNFYDKWFWGESVRGFQRGRRLGFPTINIVGKNIKIPHGVYVCQAKINELIYKGLLFFGPRPTFNETPLSLEIYLLNFNQKVKPGTKIGFKVIKFLRKVKKFNNEKELIKQIKKDLRSMI